MVEVIAIITLALLCIGQAIDKYFFTQRMLAQLDDALKASMSRNINEYMVAKNMEGSRPEPQKETDEVLLSEANDEEFDRYIKQN